MTNLEYARRNMRNPQYKVPSWALYVILAAILLPFCVWLAWCSR